MLKEEETRALVRRLAPEHLPRGTRSFTYGTLDGRPAVNVLGIKCSPRPAQGRVICIHDDAIVLKTGRQAFLVVDRELATHVPAVGDRVEVTPYALRDFTGTRTDEPTRETRTSADGRPYTTTTLVLGGRDVKLPVPAVRCPELAELIDQLERMPAPDGIRRSVHVLVDAKAADFAVVDPAADDLLKTPPELSCRVATGKCSGRVAVIYDRVLDYYRVALRHDDGRVEHTDDVDFTSLAGVLVDMIDDGEWRKIRIEVLKPVARQRAAA